MGRKNRGFTLIELIIVIVIIGILASVAAPMMTSLKAKAICAEAVTGMGAVRTAMRQHLVEKQAFSDDGLYPITNIAGCFPGLTLRLLGTNYGGSSLDGTYFSQESYFVTISGGGGTLFCSPYGLYGLDNVYPNSAPKRDDARAVAGDKSNLPTLKMDIETGKITQLNWASSGYPPE